MWINKHVFVYSFDIYFLTLVETMQGEVSVMLDLIDMLEAQQHMTIENVQPQKSTLMQLTRSRDLRVHTRQKQIKVMDPVPFL